MASCKLSVHQMGDSNEQVMKHRKDCFGIQKLIGGHFQHVRLKLEWDKNAATTPLDQNSTIRNSF